MPAKKKTTKRTPKARKAPSKGPKRTIAKRKTRAPLSKTSVSMVPTAVATTVSRMKPVFSGHSDGITVSHRELLTSVASATTDWAYNDDYDINPGNAETFPWLSNIAWSYESYRIKSIRFIYEPRCPTTQAGAVMLFTDFDSADAAPSLEQYASSYEGFIESPPYKRVVHAPRVSGLQQSKSVKYVTPSTGIPTGADPANYNCGTFYLYTTGTGTVSLGSLWVEYTIDLIHPTAGVGGVLRLATSNVGYSYAPYSDHGVTGMQSGVTNYPVTSFKDMCGDDFEPTFTQPPGGKISFDPTDYGVVIEGPGVFRANLNLVHNTAGGTQLVWNSTCSMTDAINLASTGLKFLHQNLSPYGGTLGLGVTMMSIAVVFIVTGKRGILRFLNPVYDWRYTNTGGVVPRQYALDLEIGFLEPYAPPPEMKLADYEKTLWSVPKARPVEEYSEPERVVLNPVPEDPGFPKRSESKSRGQKPGAG